MLTGSAVEFTQLYNRYYPKLLREVQRLTKNSAASEDMVQDIFLKLWDRNRDLPAIRSMEDWLYTVMRNKLIDYTRRRRLQCIHRRYLGKIGHPVTHVWVEHIGYQQIIRIAVSHLPARQKIVYRLIRERGWKIKQVAYAMNLTEQTIKNHLSLALKSLRGEIAGKLEFPYAV